MFTPDRLNCAIWGGAIDPKYGSDGGKIHLVVPISGATLHTKSLARSSPGERCFEKVLRQPNGMIRRISFLVGPAFELLDLSGPMCAFNFAREFYKAPYAINVASSSGGPIRSCAGPGPSVGTLKANKMRHGDTAIVVGGTEAHMLEQQLKSLAY